VSVADRRTAGHVTAAALVFAALGICALGLSSSGCSRKSESEPPLATASFIPARAKAPLGSPLEVTYKFVVAPDAKFAEDYRVLVHFMDSDDELMWTDDHIPPTPTTQWKPGQTIEYKRTLFVPVYPYIGQATVRAGLYSGKDNHRVPLGGETVGMREYKVGTLELLPQSENIFLIYKEGWHPAEVAQDNAAVEWQWTKRAATLAFKNPKRDVWFYLNADGRPELQSKQPQEVTVTVGDQVIDKFTLNDKESVIRKAPITAQQLGTADMVELKIDAGGSFIPAQTPAAKSTDPRELGIRVFHAFIEPK
jgi:hypothetical protein